MANKLITQILRHGRLSQLYVSLKKKINRSLEVVRKQYLLVDVDGAHTIQCPASGDGQELLSPLGGDGAHAGRVVLHRQLADAGLLLRLRECQVVTVNLAKEKFK